MEEYIKGIEMKKDSNTTITFNYELNDKTTKSKLLKAAQRTPLQIEENSTSCNLIFSAGAWVHEVLPAVQYWEQVQGDRACRIGDYEVRVSGVRAGKEGSGKTVNTQVVFYAGRDKIVCHLYNTTQLILVNGHGYRKFIDMFLKPFFEGKTNGNLQNINVFNASVITKLGPKTVKRSDIKYKKGSSFLCKSCDFSAKSISSLKKHKEGEHTNSFNLSNKVIVPRESTRNNSIVQDKLLGEDLTLTDVLDDTNKEIEDVPLKFTCFECNFVTTSKEGMDSHLNNKHVSENTEVMFVCSKCGHEFCVADDYEEHIKTHDAEDISEIEFNDLVNKIYISILEQHIQSPQDKSESWNLTNSYSNSKGKKCETCECIFRKVEDFNSHKQIFHKTPKIDVKKQYFTRCTQCDYICDLNIKMKKHIEKEHTNLRYKCSLCNLSANTVDEIWNHKLDNHVGKCTDDKADRNSRLFRLVAEQNRTWS